MHRPPAVTADCLPVAAGLKRGHTGQPVKHSLSRQLRFTATARLKIFKVKSTRLMVISLLAWLTGPEGVLAYGARHPKLLYRAIGSYQEVSVC